MNILQVGTGALKIPPEGYGGIERYIFEISRQLARQGRGVTILDIKEQDGEPATETLEGVKIMRLQTKKQAAASGAFRARYILGKLPLIRFALKASRHIRRNHYDAIHVHVTIIGAALVILNRSLRPEMVYTAHSPVWAMDAPGALDRLAVKLDCFLMRRVGRIIVQSEYMQDKLKTIPEISPDRISVVPSGVDTGIYHPAKADENITAKYGLTRKSIVLFAGRIVPYKGVIHLVKAADILVNLSGCKDVLFLLAGPLAQHGLDNLEHADYISRIEAFIKDRHLEKQVQLTGALPQADLIKLFAACDMFVLPSLAESSPAVTLQAMSSAKPVIGTAVGGIPDQIKDGWNGFIVQPADENALAGKIKYLLENPEERKLMGLRGRQLAEQKFDWACVSREIAAVYPASGTK